MEGFVFKSADSELKSHPLRSFQVVYRRAYLNRLHGLMHIFAIFCLFYYRSRHLICNSGAFLDGVLHLSILISDAGLAFMWINTLACRWSPARRREFPENLSRLVKDQELPPLDVFICTADPHREPPLSVINTALSVMAFDYPAEKISVYVSDDGGSQLTLFAFMEAAKFARHWLPFCRDSRIDDRCPNVYFRSAQSVSRHQEEKIKELYEIMEEKIERMMEIGKVDHDQLTGREEREAFKNWTDEFTRQNHPSVIQVLLESSKDVDVKGHALPNLVYVSREKSFASPHQFKAGALNVLVRVSGVMSNAPVVLTLDCDMYSNDPQTPRRALCHLLDPEKDSKLAFVQFPQRFRGINQSDIYASEFRRLYIINPMGMDGLMGPTYVGSGCFFNRQSLILHTCPSSSSQDVPNYNCRGNMRSVSSFRSIQVLKAAHEVASCTFEDGTSWGSQMGIRYGSLSEDFHTGFKLHSEGWKTVFCHPEKAAFLGEMPNNLEDALIQTRRWCVGLLQVAFSGHSPVTFGIKRISLLMGLSYAHNAFWSIWSVPILTYGLLPQLALLNRLKLFPKVSDPWFYLYLYLFIGAYAHDLLDFLGAGGSFQRWWSDQRMWMIRGVTSYPFGLVQFLLKQIGISAVGFNVTSKVSDDEQEKRYKQGIFEFGVPSPLFVPLVTVATINLVSFIVGLGRLVLGVDTEEQMLMEFLISGFVVVNSWPIYEAMLFRKDKGKMPLKTTIMSATCSWILFLIAFSISRISF